MRVTCCVTGELVLDQSECCVSQVRGGRGEDPDGLRGDSGGEADVAPPKSRRWKPTRSAG